MKATFVCEGCQTECERLGKRGRLPRFCSACRPKSYGQPYRNRTKEWAEYNALHREERRSWAREWRKAHPDERNERTKAYRATRPETVRAWGRAQHLKMHGLTERVVAELYLAQGGECAICHEPLPLEKMVIDHDHQTQERRGLLCSACNHWLFAVERRDEWVTSAGEYLASPPLRLLMVRGGLNNRERLQAQTVTPASLESVQPPTFERGG